MNARNILAFRIMVFFIVGIATTICGAGEDITGNWELTITELNQSFIIKISKTSKGTLAATSMGTPLDKITFDGSTLRFEGGSPLCLFEGTIKEDGLTIEGELQQGDQQWPALLLRVEQVPLKTEGQVDSQAGQASEEIRQDRKRLVASWKLDNDANDSAGVNHGSIHGDPAFVAGKLGQAISLDGDDHVDCGNASELNFGTSDWTLSAWINTTQTGTNEDDEQMNRGTIFANGGDEVGGIRIALILNDARLDMMTLTTDDNISNKVQTTGTTQVNDGNWHHIVGMRHGSRLLLYIDGVLNERSVLYHDYDLSGVSQHNAYIGAITDNRDNSLYKHFVGLIDEVCVFACALDANSVSALYSGKDPMTVAEQVKDVTEPPSRTRQTIDADTAKKIAGDWDATLKELNRSFVITISRNADGSLAANAFFEGPDGELMTLTFDEVTFTNGCLRLQSASIQAIFEGTMQDGGSTIEGQWQQQGQLLTLILQRAAKVEESKQTSREQSDDRISGKSNIATTLILILVLVGSIAVVVLFVVKSSIRS